IFMLGDDALNKQYRAILSFNTATLPDTAIIQSATIKIMEGGTPKGANPFAALGSLRVDIRKPYFGTTAALQLPDFNTEPSAAAVGTFGKSPSAGWYSAALNAAGLTNINKTGSTQLRLYFSLDDNNNHAADYKQFFSGNAIAANRPVLSIVYSLP
ncbi:MAG TPA: hypothetical protein VMJ64_03170, partial [Anaerolineales bacterium]|nr:hypothetical protein [Anaerolineales bacterium]